MSARVKEWARRARAKLMSTLGNQCAWCGNSEKLTFDCIYPLGDQHHRMSTDQRMSFYHGQHKAGNLQILCASCNAKKSDTVTEVPGEMNWEHLGELQPF